MSVRDEGKNAKVFESVTLLIGNGVAQPHINLAFWKDDSWHRISHTELDNFKYKRPMLISSSFFML
jgi:hypothetical protein